METSPEQQLPSDSASQSSEKSSIDDHEQVLRKSIITIHSDPNLNAGEKAHKIQELMNPMRLKSLKGQERRSKKDLSIISLEGSMVRCLDFLDEADLNDVQIDESGLKKSFHEIDGETFHESHGCKHYKSNSKFMAECCMKWFPCRFCHNECSDHEVDRFATRFCLCQFCDTIQRAAQTCVNSACGKNLAFYYCDNCKFWDNDESKKIFHCGKCGVCRNGSRDNYVHCDKCNACLSKEYYNNHKCIERSLECDCPICGEYLFTTTLPIIFMPCGHGIHFLCHREHLQSSYQCPVCLKSVTDMSHFFNQIDLMLANHQMPSEYNRVRSLILCNDCEHKSAVKFHFVYHKCIYCKSYNTKVIKTFNEDEPIEDDENEPPTVVVEDEVEDNNPHSDANSPYLEH